MAKGAINYTTKPCLLKPTYVHPNPFLFCMQGTSKTVMPNNVRNGLYCNQMPELKFILLNNLGDIGSSMQGGLGGLFNVNMGIWNPL